MHAVTRGAWIIRGNDALESDPQITQAFRLPLGSRFQLLVCILMRLARAPFPPQHEAQEYDVHRSEATVFDRHPGVKIVAGNGAFEREWCSDVELRHAIEDDDEPIEVLRELHVERVLGANDHLQKIELLRTQGGKGCSHEEYERSFV